MPASGPIFFFSTVVPIEGASLAQSLKIAFQPDTCDLSPDSLIPAYRLAFAAPDRASYALWRYNSFVQACANLPLSAGGGNRITHGLLKKFHLLLGP